MSTLEASGNKSREDMTVDAELVEEDDQGASPSPDNAVALRGDYHHGAPSTTPQPSAEVAVVAPPQFNNVRATTREGHEESHEPGLAATLAAMNITMANLAGLITAIAPALGVRLGGGAGGGRNGRPLNPNIHMPFNNDHRKPMGYDAYRRQNPGGHTAATDHARALNTEQDGLWGISATGVPRYVTAEEAEHYSDDYASIHDPLRTRVARGVGRTLGSMGRIGQAVSEHVTFTDGLDERHLTTGEVNAINLRTATGPKGGGNVYGFDKTHGPYSRNPSDAGPNVLGHQHPTGGGHH